MTVNRRSDKVLFMFLRRLLLIALVLATLWACFGCATPAIQCGMRDDYSSAEPFPVSGEVTIRWRYYAQPSNPNAYGDADCWEQGTRRFCELRLVGDPANFNDVCKLAKLGHEVGHGLGRH